MRCAWTLQSLLPFTGPPDRRSPAEIDADLEEEFAFHLEMKTRELISEGHAPEDARALAYSSFGDLQAIKMKCRRIALEERIMLQRINLVLMIIVLIMVVIVGIQVLLTQRYNTLALLDITSQLAKMRVEAAAEARDRGWAPPGDDPADGQPADSGVSEPPFTAPRTGQWRQIEAADGAVSESGVTLLLLSAEDFRNPWGVSGAVAQLPGGEGEIGLTFLPDAEANLIVREIDAGSRTTRGRWWPIGDDLILNFNHLRPAMTRPVRVRWTEPADDRIQEWIEDVITAPDPPSDLDQDDSRS